MLKLYNRNIRAAKPLLMVGG